jgi:hypothetical protein
MAQGKSASITVKSNKKTDTPVAKTVELVVLGGILIQDPKDEFPGVNTADFKNY